MVLLRFIPFYFIYILFSLLCDVELSDCPFFFGGNQVIQ